MTIIRGFGIAIKVFHFNFLFHCIGKTEWIKVNLSDKGSLLMAEQNIAWNLWFWFDFCFTALQHILGHFGSG